MISIKDFCFKNKFKGIFESKLWKSKSVLLKWCQYNLNLSLDVKWNDSVLSCFY